MDLFTADMTETQRHGLSSPALTHLRDAVCELMVRTALAALGRETHHGLHRATVAMVQVPAQAAANAAGEPLGEAICSFRLQQSAAGIFCANWGVGVYMDFYSASASSSHRAETASLGMRQSPRGDRVTVPTLGPSGRQDRLNCWEKNRR